MSVSLEKFKKQANEIKLLIENKIKEIELIEISSLTQILILKIELKGMLTKL